MHYFLHNLFYFDCCLNIDIVLFLSECEQKKEINQFYPSILRENAFSNLNISFYMYIRMFLSIKLHNI